MVYVRHTYHIRCRVWISVTLSLHAYVRLDALSYGQLARALTDLSEICATESVRHLREIVQINILRKQNNGINK